MKGDRADRKGTAIQLSVITILVFICISGLTRIYGFSLFPDEFGYWAAAAHAIGYDWSRVASMGSYYSFGYAAVLIPILMIFHDSVIAYRAAVCVNLICQIAGYLILCRLSERLFEKTDREYRLILCGIATLYPSWVFYTRTTMAEGLVFFTYTLAALCIVRYMEKPGALRGFILAFVLCFMYSVHMRMIGTVIAGTLVVIIYTVMNRNRESAVTEAVIHIALVILMLCVIGVIRGNLIGSLYSHAESSAIAVNTYEGQSGKLTQILTPRGAWDFLLNLIGKLLYLGCASFGMAYIGLYALVKKSLDIVRSVRSNGHVRVMSGDLLHVYVTLASLAQIGVMSIYLSASADTAQTRLDLFLHGRYDDPVIPLLIIYGIYTLTISDNPYKSVVIADIVMAMSAVISTVVVMMNTTQMNDPHNMLMVGMSYLLQGEEAQPIWYIAAETAFSITIGAIIICAIMLYRRTTLKLWIAVPAIIFTICSVTACSRMLDAAQIRIYGDVELADRIAVISGNDRRVVDLYEDGNAYADVIQLRLRDTEIIPIYVEGKVDILSTVSPSDIVLTDWQSALRSELGDIYEINYDMGHFTIFYNP